MIKLDDALSAVSVLGLDTPPFIYFIERHPRYTDVLREVFRRIDAGTMVGRSSVVTLTEVLTQPKQRGDASLEGEYRSLLRSSRNFALVPIDEDVADSAANLRARFGLRTPDALQIAAAVRAGCEAFLTNDLRLRNVSVPRILVLDELEL